MSDPMKTDEGKNDGPGQTKHGKLWMAVRLAEVRLRFIAIMVVTGLLVANLESIQNHIDRWTRPASRAARAWSRARRIVGRVRSPSFTSA